MKSTFLFSVSLGCFVDLLRSQGIEDTHRESRFINAK
jgi:hypothetical protein